MLTGMKWLAGALAAALWVAPAAARTSSSGEQDGSGTASETGGMGQTGQTMVERAGDRAEAMGQQATSGVARTLAKLHADNEAEIEAGTWMKENATNEKVKEYASKMVDDHGSMDKEIMSFAESKQIDLTSAPKPADMEKGKKKMSLDDLKSMKGAQADRAYMKMMVDDHTKGVKETRAAAQRAKKSDDKELASLLDETAKTMEEHLTEARKIQREVSQRQARTPSR